MASSWWTTRSIYIYIVTCQVTRLNSFSSCCDPKYSTSRCCSALVHGCETGWGAAFGRYLLQISLTAYNTCVMLFTCILYIYICNLRLYNDINTYLGRVCTYYWDAYVSWTFGLGFFKEVVSNQKYDFFAVPWHPAIYIGIWNLTICKYFQEVCVFRENRVMWPMWMFSNPGLSGLSSLISWWWINDRAPKETWEMHILRPWA